MKVLISGIGIAGPALAFWLERAGHEVTLVEVAPEIRSGGYVIDFWGIGFDVAEKMGLISEIRSLGYQMQEVRIVDDRGRTSSSFSAEVFARMTKGRYTSIRRSDISTTIFRALDGRVETIFGDSTKNIDDAGTSVQADFEKGPSRSFDMVVGADGLHSRVRNLVFGPEKEFEAPLGYHVAAFEAVGYPYRDELVYVSHGAPGKQISRFSMNDDRTLFLFVFRDELLRGETPRTDEERKQSLSDIFSDTAWEWPAVKDALSPASDLYFDRVSQIKMDSWTKGRTALIGDAAACISLLGGEGTGLAITEAYVLAGSLAANNNDLATAFAEYQNRLMPFLKRKQTGAAKFASSFAPNTRLGLKFRDLVVNLLRIPFIANYFVGRDLRDDIQLPDYKFDLI